MSANQYHISLRVAPTLKRYTLDVSYERQGRVQQSIRLEGTIGSMAGHGVMLFNLAPSTHIPSGAPCFETNFSSDTPRLIYTWLVRALVVHCPEEYLRLGFRSAMSQILNVNTQELPWEPKSEIDETLRSLPALF